MAKVTNAYDLPARWGYCCISYTYNLLEKKKAEIYTILEVHFSTMLRLAYVLLPTRS